MITLKVDCQAPKDYPVALLKDALRAVCNQIGNVAQFNNLPLDGYLKNPYYKELAKAIDVLEKSTVMLSVEELNLFIADLMIKYGPDGHCDGSEIIAKKVRDLIINKFFGFNLKNELIKLRRALNDDDIEHEGQVCHSFFKCLKNTGFGELFSEEEIRKIKEDTLG